MTSITVQDRLEAANVSAKMRHSQDAQQRRLGELLLVATQVEAFDHNYSTDAIVKASMAITYAALGADRLMAKALEELHHLRTAGVDLR